MTGLVLIGGTRPNFVKIAALWRVLALRGTLKAEFVHTGQHYDLEMSQYFTRDLGLPEPAEVLGVGSGTHAEQTGRVMIRLEPYLKDMRPAAVIVFGDVNSTLAAALTAVKLQIPVVHVEAGLRSYDRMMPEEVNRVVTDVLSDLLFAPSEDAVRNLVREGIDPKKIHLVGNVMIDMLDLLRPLTTSSSVMSRLGVTPGNFLLATLHRPTNVDDARKLGEVVKALNAAASILPLVFVAHPRTRRRLHESGLIASLNGVKTIGPLGYIDFLRLMSESAAVLTDSGGIQEETTVLGIPCLTLRRGTERPITVSAGTNQVVGLDRERIISAIERISSGGWTEPRRPPLWDGHAADRIVAILERLFWPD